MQEQLSGFQFVSISYIFNLYDSPDDIFKYRPSSVNNTIIDITNLIRDNHSNLIIIETYLKKVTEDFLNVHLSIQYDYLMNFKEKFPYFFCEDSMNFDFNIPSTEISEGIIELRKLEPSLKFLYTYSSQEEIIEFLGDNSIISLAHLIQESDGLTYRYNIEDINRIIKERKISHIDVSSLVKSLKSRNDLIFQFETLIYKISSVHDIKYSIEYDLINEVLEIFPLLFKRENKISCSINEKEIKQEKKEVNIEQVKLWGDKIDDSLKGHIIFKKDFSHNLLKFSYLNKMKVRKVLSIFLCGESGIGKTEFSKIVSNVIYPDETLIKINFGNYSTEGVLNSLIGSPLGYIGSEEGGELINKIGSSKSKVILIDEFERATPSVYNFFYELLEDGKFTDRHGKEHDLDGYIIVLTSNMTESQFQKHIPDSLKSRFDMVYKFENIDVNEKLDFINKTAKQLIANIKKEFGYELEYEKISKELKELKIYNNLREIKRKVEDIVFSEYLKSVSQ